LNVVCSLGIHQEGGNNDEELPNYDEEDRFDLDEEGEPFVSLGVIG
jgi:hypothetical protein